MHARPDEQSLVGGLFNTGTQVGGGLGPTVMGVVAVRRIGVGSSVEALLADYRAAFWTAVGIATAGLPVAVFWVRQVRSDGPVTAD